MFIENFKQAHRLLSIHVAALAVAFGSLNTETQQAILALLHVPAHRIPAVIGVAMIVARLIKQKTPAAPDQE